MKCPNCGEQLKENKYKCMRCGYECKSLIANPNANTEDEKNSQKQNSNKQEEAKNIDPSQVYMSKAAKNNNGGFGGGIFSGFGGGLFDNLFSGFGNIFSLFGDDDDDEEESDYYDDFGNELPIDVFDRDFVEIGDVEYVEDDDDWAIKEEEKTTENNEENNENHEYKKKGVFDKIKDKVKCSKNKKHTDT